MTRKKGKPDVEDVVRGKFAEVILNTDDPVEFLTALCELDADITQTALDDLPEPARMARVLRGLYLRVDSGGIAEFLAQRDVGGYLDDAVTWLRMLGAERAIEYLESARALFPHASIPADEEERLEQVMELEGRSASIFRRLDRKYEDAMPQMVERFRAYLRERSAGTDATLRGYSSHAHLDVGAWDNDVISPVDQVALFAQMNAMSLEPRADREAGPGIVDPRALRQRERTNAVELGTVIELVTGKGLAYLQVTHSHVLQPALGPVVRVVSGVFPRRPPDLKPIVEGETAFHTFLDSDAVSNSTQATVVGSLPVPESEREFPTFRYWLGRTRAGVDVWGLWTGGDATAGYARAPLTTGQRSWPLFEVPGLRHTINRILRGWRPEMTPDSPA